jgi:5-(carboxyamino)imidazole ribonucleotide mutase
MPSGVPVATVAIDGAKNAALLAVQILAQANENLYQKFLEYKKRLSVESMKKNVNLPGNEQ